MQNQRFDGFSIFVNGAFSNSNEIQFRLTVKAKPIGYLQLVDDYRGGSKLTLIHVSRRATCFN